jgi:hypothetical protein
LRSRTQKRRAIPSSVTSIGGNAFAECYKLTSVTIPKSVTNIRIKAFYRTSLASVTIGNSVTNIGAMAFKYSTNLASAIIPNSVAKIEDDAFSCCPSLTGVYFQGNAPRLGSSVFDKADKATVYYLPETTGWGSTFGGRSTALYSPSPSPPK